MIRLISMNPPSFYIEICFILTLYGKKRTAEMAYSCVPSAVKVITAQRIAPFSEPEKDFK